MIGDCQRSLSVQHFVPGPACIAHRLPARRSQPKQVHSARPCKGTALRPSFKLFAAADPRGAVFNEPGTLPEQGSPALASIMGEVNDKHSGVVGEKSTYAIDASGQKGDVIYVEDTFNSDEAEGVRLTEELTVGKQMAGGTQGAIYELKSPDGKDSGQLLKVLKFKAVLPITGNDIGLKREWIIGQHLNKLRGPKGELQGFMGTGAAVIRKSDQGLEGLILEKVNGAPLEKRLLKDDTFADASYILEMMTQCFAALDKANKDLGYVHRDMRISNIMEHRTDAEPYLPKGYSSGQKTFQLAGDKRPKGLKFAIIDNGHARLLGSKVPGKLPEVPALEKMYRKWFAGKSDVWRLCSDIVDIMDGRSWPIAQKKKVQAISDLSHEVTGVRMYSFFKEEDEKWRKNHGLLGSVRHALTLWQRCGKPGHGARRGYIRFRLWFFPRKTRFSPAEALDYLRERKVLPDEEVASSSS
ncbi:g11635 [Coccomyxa viridis]|uniref:G11635 protein n=1 Tax=Coccomyxa viridis TaxID=1274662 RepID=A0ABP1GB08_9CHLO